MVDNWKWAATALCVTVMSAFSAQALSEKSVNEEADGLFIPVSRSELVVVPHDIAEVIVADPDIADVHVIGAKRVAFIGKKLGHTNTKLFDKDNHVIRQFDIVVGYDIPAIRKALHSFLPHERIGVELVNTNIALTGEISNASVADEAIRIVNQFVSPPTSGGGAAAPAAAGGSSGGSGASGLTTTTVLNLMKVISGQQVMLRVRVAEIQRSALKQLGVELAGQSVGANIFGGSQGGFQSFISGTGAAFPALTDPSSYAGATPNVGGVLRGVLTSGGNALSVGLDALETDGLLKTLAEPNLVAMSGEKAEFLAGGQIAVPVVQPGGTGTTALTTVQFVNFGVAVQFIPLVLSENRIRLSVEPEVSAIDKSNGTTSNGNSIPGLDVRRAKTTVELAPGESFMIAGLMNDSVNSSISQIPGASDLPILGALFRSTAFQRNETELVIAVTPYIVDPLKSSDVHFPTDDFRPASDMEMFFYGALGTLSGNASRISQTPSLEGPIGFMTD